MAKKKMSPRKSLTRDDRVEMMQTGRKPKRFLSAGRPSTRIKAKK